MGQNAWSGRAATLHIPPMKPPIFLQFQRQNPRRTMQAASAVEILVIVMVSVVLAGFMFPGFHRTCVRSPQTRALAQTKQVGLALKLYAGDHDDVYPDGTNLHGETIRTSNDAFRSLFPTYTQSETLFGNRLSAWQRSVPDNVITPISEALKPGENVYAYVAGFKADADPSWPLVAEGTDGTGHYATDQNARGGVWKGTSAIVIRNDNSGALEHLIGPEKARYVPRSQGSKQNLLDVAAYIGPQAKLLDPAVPPAAKK
jgi:hypothetical protein